MSTRIDEYEGAPELSGRIVYQPGWYLLEVPVEQTETLADGLGVAVKPATRPHVSVMKGEAPSRNEGDWGTAFVGEQVTVRYSPVLKGDNGLHLWIDCYSPRLCEMREHFGLVTLKRDSGEYLVNFHVTVARRKKAVGKQLRPQLRLNPQSHIDVETGMQHL